jgi:uncharacterized OB-fold protein
VTGAVGHDAFELVSPQVRESYRPFFDACRRNTLVIPRCAGCDRLHWYLPTICSSCGSMTFGWSEMSGRGIVYSFTVIRHRFLEDVVIPSAIGVIELVEQPGLMMVARIVDDPERVRIGADVVVAFSVRGTEAAVLPAFTLVNP